MLLDPLNPKLKWFSFSQTLYRMKSNFLRELSTWIQYQTHQFHLHCFHFHKSDGFWCCFLVYTVCFLWLLIFLFLFSLSLKSSMLILLPGNIRTFECLLLVLPSDGDPFLIVSSISITQPETLKDASWASWHYFTLLSFYGNLFRRGVLSVGYIPHFAKLMFSEPFSCSFETSSFSS